MKHRVISYSVEVIAAALLSIQTAQAQDSAPGLQDLVGARGSSGEQMLQKRGYPFVRAKNPAAIATPIGARAAAPGSASSSAPPKANTNLWSRRRTWIVRPATQLTEFPPPDWMNTAAALIRSAG